MLEYQADLIHAHDFPMLAPAIKLAETRNVPLIYDAHELYYAQVQIPKSIQRIYRRKEASLIPHCDAVITVNPYIAELMSARYRIETPHVILNASPLRPVSADQPLRSKFNLPDDAKIVLYQGWISANRGIERITEAASHFDEGIYVVVVGYGDFETQLKEMTVKSGLTKKVLFYGGVPSEELHEITCDADLGVIPYHGVDENNYFCSPNKLFEFSVAELPFICNDLPFLKDIINRFGNGEVADLSTPRSIAAAVNGVFSSPDRLEALKAGARSARKELNWEVEEKTLLEIYGDLQKKRGLN